MKSLHLLATMAGMWLLGCGSQANPTATHGEQTSDSDAPSYGASTATWLLVAQPSDLSTDIGSSEISVIVQYAMGTRHPSQTVLDEVAAALTVMNQSGEEVPTKIEPIRGETSDGAPDVDTNDEWFKYRDRILITPASPWRSEWHSVVVGEMSSKYRLVGFKASAAGAGGIMRFTVDSLPIYQSLEFCDFGREKGSRLSISLSQPVKDREAISTRLSVVADGSSCSFKEPYSEYGGVSARTIEVWCQATDVSSLSFTVDEPLIALDGKAVTNLEGNSLFTVAWPSGEWAPKGTGCWTWSP